MLLGDLGEELVDVEVHGEHDRVGGDVAAARVEGVGRRAERRRAPAELDAPGREVPRDRGRRLPRVDLQVARPAHPADGSDDRGELGDLRGRQQLPEPGLLEERQLVVGAGDQEGARVLEPEAGALGEPQPDLSRPLGVQLRLTRVDARADLPEVAHARAHDPRRPFDDDHAQAALDRRRRVTEADDARSHDREVEALPHARPTSALSG